MRTVAFVVPVEFGEWPGGVTARKVELVLRQFQVEDMDDICTLEMVYDHTACELAHALSLKGEGQ